MISIGETLVNYSFVQGWDEGLEVLHLIRFIMSEASRDDSVAERFEEYLSAVADEENREVG